MGNTKKASKKRLLRRKTKKQNTKQSNENPAAGMSRLEYQQALLDPRFRAAMIGFNGSVGMGSQQSAQLRELEMKSNDIIRNINFQEQKMNLAKNLEEKKKEQRKLADDYEMERIKNKNYKELESIKSKINKIQMQTTHQEAIDPLNDQLSNMKEEDDIRQRERRYKEESFKLKNETMKRSRMQQMQAELDVLKEQKDKAETEYERTQLERQYHDKRKQYEHEKARLEAKLSYNNSVYRDRELQAAIEMDRAEKDLEEVKYIADLKDRADKANRSTNEALVKLLGSNVDMSNTRDVKSRVIAIRNKAVSDIANNDNIMRDLKDVEDVYNQSIKAKRDLDKAAIKVNTILEHRTDPDFDRFIETTRQNIETERLQNEEIKKAQGDIQAVMDDKKNAVWTLEKTFNEFMTKNPNAQLVAQHVALQKRGRPEISIDDWSDILNFCKEYELKVRDVLLSPIKKLASPNIQSQYKGLLQAIKKEGIDTDKVIQQYRDDVANVTELQNRAKQADMYRQQKGFYATKITAIHDGLPEGYSDWFVENLFTDPAAYRQAIADTLEYNKGVYPLDV